MFERCVHFTMWPTECIDDGSTVFICKLIERYARYIELYDVNGIGKEGNWLLFEIEDRHASRRSFPGRDQFAREPQTASAVGAKMQMYGKCFLRRNRASQIGEAMRCVKSSHG